MRYTRAKLLVIGLVSSASLAAAACSDSVHLGPFPDTRTSSSGGSGGAGGEATGAGGAVGPGCSSNSDCPAPTAVCDTVKGTCVECLAIADCAFRPGTICSSGACVCPAAVDSFCPAVPGLGDRCVNLVTASNDCGSCNHPCFGACNNGKCADPWEPTATAAAPSPRREHVAVWTGTKMIVWGGFDGSDLRTGGVYDPAARTWQSTSLVNVPSARRLATAVWTDSKMIVWGGYNAGPLASGGVFDPQTNTWQTVATKDAPSARYGHSAVWTGTKMLVWGGWDGGTNLVTGGQYDPATDTWTPITPNGAPTMRRDHTAVWTGTSMIVFGGYGFDPNLGADGYLASGGEYAPAGDSWLPLQPIGQPSVRANHTAVWTSMEMLIWGGFDGSAYIQDGAKYSVTQSAWTPMNGPFPDARRHHTALWLNSKMIVWGGENQTGFLNSGGQFNPATNSWDAKDLPTALSARSHHTAVAAGTKMLIWGGDTASGVTNTGGLFDTAFAP